MATVHFMSGPKLEPPSSSDRRDRRPVRPSGSIRDGCLGGWAKNFDVESASFLPSFLLPPQTTHERRTERAREREGEEGTRLIAGRDCGAL